MSAPSSLPCGPIVQIVALRTITASGCSGSDDRPYSIIGRMNGRFRSGTLFATAPTASPSKAAVREPLKDGSAPFGSDVQP